MTQPDEAAEMPSDDMADMFSNEMLDLANRFKGFMTRDRWEPIYNDGTIPELLRFINKEKSEAQARTRQEVIQAVRDGMPEKKSHGYTSYDDDMSNWAANITISVHNAAIDAVEAVLRKLEENL